MIPKYVHGPISNVFTAWNAEKQFDEQGQRNLLDYLAQSGCISAYFVRSGMGQMYAFAFDEVKRMAALACEHLRNVGPVLVGSAGEWDRDYDKRPDPKVFLAQSIELGKYAVDQGAAGVVYTMPEAILPTGNQTFADVVLSYFEAIDKAINMPIFLYQPPKTRPEYCVTMDTAARLADLPNVMGIKISTDDVRYTLNICCAIADKDFAFIAGSETSFLGNLYAGAVACIGQGCTINPAIICAVQDRFDAGDRMGAIAAQRSVNMLCEESESPVAFLKRYATEKGYPVPLEHREMTSPMYEPPRPLTDAHYAAFKRILEAEMEKYA